MGGLRKGMPITHAVMLIGSAAIIGIPIFSGFFSKDEILYSVIASPRGGWAIYAIALFAAFLTAVYTTRMMAMTFYGEVRGGHKGHESSWVMILPLIILALLATFGGFLGMPHEFGPHLLSHWLDPVVPKFVAEHAALPELTVSGIAVGVGVLGIALALTLFKNISFESSPLLKRLFVGQHFMDTFYQSWVVRPLYWLSRSVVQFFEGRFMENIGGWLGSGTVWSADRLRAVQSGDIQTYMFALTTGLALVVGILIFWARI